MEDEKEPLLGRNRSSVVTRRISPASETTPPGKSDGDATESPRELIRTRQTIGFISGVFISASLMIGAGIFISPNMVLNSSNGNVGVSLIIWIAGGLTAILSALCYNELAASVPESGADYSYVNYAYGPAIAFLIPWMNTFLPTSDALTAIMFARYALQPFFPDGGPPVNAVKLLAICGVILVTAINCIDAKFAVRVQVMFTITRFLAVGFVLVGGLVYLGRDSSVAVTTFSDLFDPATLNGITFLTLSNSFFQVMFTYSGWNSLCFVTEEIENSARNIPLATVASVILVLIAYLIVNVAYLLVLKPSEMMRTSAVATAFAEKLLYGTSWPISMMVALVALGSYFGSVLTYGRTPYVAARRGHLPQIVGMLHIHRYTPLPGLILNALPCLVLVFVGDVSSLVDAFGFVSWTFYGLVSGSVLILRRKMPNLNRPFKVWTSIPILMILISLFFVILPFFNNPHFLYLYSLAFFGIGLVVFYVFVHRKLRVPGMDQATEFLQKLLVVAPADWESVN